MVSANLKTCGISILRNITIDGILPYITYLHHKIGMDAKIQMGNYDTIVQDINDDTIITPQTNYLFIFTSLSEMTDLVRLNDTENDTFRVSEKKRLEQLMNFILLSIRKKSKARILWNAFEDTGPTNSETTNQLKEFVSQLNEHLKLALLEHGNGFYIDNSLAIDTLSPAKYYDPIGFTHTKSLYSLPALKMIASNLFRVVQALEGKSKKCIILDADNTLWKGIIGEDGIENIDISSGFEALQEVLLNLHKQGVLLTLCSKNNSQEVMDVLQNHPKMLIKKQHLAATRINWNNKADNIVEIAKELNIGLDSLVFIDDNPFEINLINQTLPEITTINLSEFKELDYAGLLKDSELFSPLPVTKEDSNRTEMLQNESFRKETFGEFADINSYLKSLEMHLHIVRCAGENIPRIAQLTQKTNQFNLTGKRYSEDEIKEFISVEGNYIFYVEVTDRFGNLGITGVCILRKKSTKTSEIDTFLLSCRIIGREIENAFLQTILNYAFNAGIVEIKAFYIPTKKNLQTLLFFENNGFDLTEEKENYKSYSIQKIKYKKQTPSTLHHITVELHAN